MPFGTRLAHNWAYIDPDSVYPNPEQMNATLPPNDPNADTEFSYMTADGSDNAAFMEPSGMGGGVPEGSIVDASGASIVDSEGRFVVG